MAIMAEFLCHLRDSEDLDGAFQKTTAKYETHIAALDPRSDVATFFKEHVPRYFSPAVAASTLR